MNVCNICRHPDRAMIDAAVALGQPLRSIAQKYAISEHALGRHKRNPKCLGTALEIARTTKTIKAALVTQDEVRDLFAFAKKMRDSLDEWLTDPDNQHKYTLDLRADETSIIYKEIIDYTEKGRPIYEKRREKLQQLLDRVKAGTSYEITLVEGKRSDPRKLIIEVLDQLHRDCDMLARLCGDYQQDRLNEHDQALIRETTIQALTLLHHTSRTEAEKRLESDEAALAGVWDQAERLAKAVLASEAVQ